MYIILQKTSKNFFWTIYKGKSKHTTIFKKKKMLTKIFYILLFKTIFLIFEQK